MTFLTTQYTLNGEIVEFPDLPSGTAIKNAAKRFGSAYNLPAGAAFALAANMVDPAAARTEVDAKQPMEHLQPMETPSGKFLLTHHARLWTPGVSGDGSNGRSRYDIQTTNGSGTPMRPWPIGLHLAPAIIDYPTLALDDMIAAAKLSATKIRSPELITQIGRNPRGIWNPPVVVLARAYVRLEDGSIVERWFLHTIEGSTRVEACHEMTGTDPGAPLKRSDDPLAHIRESHAQLADTFDTLPTSQKSLAAARAATMPALIVVAVVEEDGLRPISTGFPEVINDYVESVHVQPRPFSDVAQSNVLGERFLLTLKRCGKLSGNTAGALLGREHNVPGKPSTRAATLVHEICDSANETTIRDFVITEPGSRLTKARRAKLIGPLVARQFSGAAESTDRALMRAFTPDALLDNTWTISGVSAEKLRKQCLKDVNDGNLQTLAMLELQARGGPALCATGLLLSDQGSTVKGIAKLRGSVEKVVEALVKKPGGVSVLCDAIAWADGERAEKPREYDVEGNVKTDEKTGDPRHYSAAWEKGNMGVRALAFTDDGEIPMNGSSRTTSAPDPAKTPEEQYKASEDTLIEMLTAARTALLDMASATDEQGRKLMKRLGLRNVVIYEQLPTELAKLFAKYGDADPLAAFDEDELPDGDPDGLD
jgi:hypothetical protein